MAEKGPSRGVARHGGRLFSPLGSGWRTERAAARRAPTRGGVTDSAPETEEC